MITLLHLQNSHTQAIVIDIHTLVSIVFVCKVLISSFIPETFKQLFFSALLHNLLYSILKIVGSFRYVSGKEGSDKIALQVQQLYPQLRRHS